MMPLGTAAPQFKLMNVDGQEVSLSDFAGKPLLVMFICNHCPYVIHLADHLAQFTHEFQSRGLGIVGISSNDVSAHPEDSPEQMVHEAEGRGYVFPYLYDETQEIAQAYRAACTPDFFLFDKNHQLVYRGQYDNSRPKTDIPITGDDLRAACDAVLAEEAIPEDQTPSMGCYIKWISGSEPEYFDPKGVS